MRLPAPIDAQPHYGEHLGDVGYWRPYVREVLRREGLGLGEIELPFVGTFPTFLVEEHAVKLFGRSYGGGESWAVERSMHDLLATQSDLPVPELVASGALFEDSEGWHWPYLVTRRLRGTAVRDRPLDGTPGLGLAAELGEVVATLHQLQAPSAVEERSLVAELRASAPSRMSQFGLPDHLVEQVPSFLSDAPDPVTLVHADITADHLFHDGKKITGIIDWGDAMVAARAYELVPIAFDCFSSDSQLLQEFLRCYGWALDADFPRVAMQAVCEFQFDVVSFIKDLVDLDTITSLDSLADRLFGSLRLA